MITGPGQYRDRLGRIAIVISRARHDPSRWVGVAGDGDPVCWESDGVMECSLPSSIDIVAKVPTA